MAAQDPLSLVQSVPDITNCIRCVAEMRPPITDLKLRVALLETENHVLHERLRGAESSGEPSRRLSLLRQAPGDRAVSFLGNCISVPTGDDATTSLRCCAVPYNMLHERHAQV